MTKILLLSMALCCGILNLHAQVPTNNANNTGPSCQPVKCGPEGTKTGEAAIIGHLRTEALNLEDILKTKSIVISDEKNLVGSDDSESVSLISVFIMRMHAALISQADEEKLNQELVNLKFDSSESPARVVSQLLQHTILLQEQAKLL
ncbi:MAG: hypothetical protein RJQ09_12650 [Cyclobacteriaceae bacterium]